MLHITASAPLFNAKFNFAALIAGILTGLRQDPEDVVNYVLNIHACCRQTFASVFRFVQLFLREYNQVFQQKLRCNVTEIFSVRYSESGGRTVQQEAPRRNTQGGNGSYSGSTEEGSSQTDSAASSAEGDSTTETSSGSGEYYGESSSGK